MRFFLVFLKMNGASNKTRQWVKQESDNFHTRWLRFVRYTRHMSACQRQYNGSMSVP